MIDAVVPHGFGKLRILIVAGEHANGQRVVIGMDNDFAAHTGRAAVALLIHQIHVKDGAGLAHAAGAHLHKGEGGKGDHQLGLTEGLKQRNIGALEPFGGHIGVERLASHGAMMQTA